MTPMNVVVRDTIALLPRARTNASFWKIDL
jgi:hypothetical protein